MNKHVIIVGAGIAGLTAGIYARRSGFEVTLIEQHSIVGGMCTSWKRKGYLFEGAMHWLTGSKPGSQVHEIWRDTGALEDTVIVSLDDPFAAVEYDGGTLYLYRNIEKTAEGSLPFVSRMEKTFRALGGTLLLSTKVEKVSIQNGVATGVQLKDKVIEADAVIVAQETIAAKS